MEALRILHAVPEGLAEARMLRQIALEVGGRMVRTRGVTVRVAQGRTVRFAATPAIIYHHNEILHTAPANSHRERQYF